MMSTVKYLRFIESAEGEGSLSTFIFSKSEMLSQIKTTKGCSNARKHAYRNIEYHGRGEPTL